MKLGVIVNNPSPHQNSLLDALVSLPDVDVLVAYAFPANVKRKWGIPRVAGHSIVVPWRLGLGCIKRLIDWIESEDRDVWILGSVFTALRTQALVSALACSGKPWVFLGEPPRPRQGLHALVRDTLLNRVLRNCDGVIATGIESARRYRALMKGDRAVVSVPYYIPLEDWFRLPPVSRPNAADTIRFVTLSQLIRRKGLDVLVEACRRLPRQGWSLDVFGDGPERNRLRRLVVSYDLPVTFHPALPFDLRISGFSGMHCFVLPTRWDGWGMVVVEALAAGLPVICTDQAMSAFDFIEAGRNGWIVECDASAISAAMTEVIKNRDCLGLRSVAARNSVSGYVPQSGADAIARYCRSLIAERGNV